MKLSSRTLGVRSCWAERVVANSVGNCELVPSFARPKGRDENVSSSQVNFLHCVLHRYLSLHKHSPAARCACLTILPQCQDFPPKPPTNSHDLPVAQMYQQVFQHHDAPSHNSKTLQSNTSSHPHLNPHISSTATMPSEVTDIKTFLEIARRKDAKCTL